MKYKESLDQDQINDIVKGLENLKPGFLPFPIFKEICRLIVTSIVEIIPLRENKKTGSIEILLTKREKNDIFWPDLFHIPGVVLLPTDRIGNLKDAFSRILHGELKGAKSVLEPVFIKYLFRKSKRGTELCLLHWVELVSKGQVGRWFDIDKLPCNIIYGQKRLIKIGISNFVKYKRNNI